MVNCLGSSKTSKAKGYEASYWRERASLQAIDINIKHTMKDNVGW